MEHEKHALPELIDQLPEQERVVIEALYFERATLRSVADRIGVPHPQMVVHIQRRAESRLRRLLTMMDESGVFDVE